MTLLRAGTLPHAAVDAEMVRLQALRIADEIPDTLIFVEHPEVVTIGRRAQAEGLVPSPGYPARRVDRGGGLTWHGPGQLVAYPVFRWRLAGEESVAAVVARLEAWLIAALTALGVPAERDARMPGAWVAGHKVASLGLAFRSWVSRHGCDVNLATPPGRVEALMGCGLPEGRTTSLTALGYDLGRTELEATLLAAMPAALGREATRTRAVGAPPWELPRPG